MERVLFIVEEAGSDQLLQLRDCFEQIRYQTVIGHLEDRRFFVLVDRNDHLGVLHARQMLDRAGDTDRDVQLWRNDLAGLTDLHVVGHETGIDGSARSTNRSAQLVRQRVEVLEVVTVLHAATAGNDDFGSRQLWTVGLGQLFADEARLADVVSSRNRFDRRRTAFCSNRIEAGGTHGDDLDRSSGLHGGNALPA